MNFRPLLLAAIVAFPLGGCTHLQDPAETSAQHATEALEGTYWKLTRLNGNPVSVHDQQREPSLVLDPEGRRASGSGGCNRFMGSYALDGERISFGQLAMTRMACAQGMDTEAAFTNALSQAKSWQVKDKRLELYDADGELLAEFVAQPLT